MNENIVYLGPSSAEGLIEDINRALASSPSGHIRIQVEPERHEPQFERNDIVRVPFDHGHGPARVSHVDGDHVVVRYQAASDHRPIGEVHVSELPYSTSLHRSSVTTTNRVTHPAVLKVKVGEGTWSPPIRSELPNGGYALDETFPAGSR